MSEVKNMNALAQRLESLIEIAEAYQQHLLDLRAKQQGAFGSPKAERLSHDLHFHLEQTKIADETLWRI